MAGLPVLGLAGILMATQLVPPTADTGVLRQRLRIAEDARASRPEQRDLLVGAVSHEDVGVRLLAVRALGRLERADVIPVLAGALEDVSLEVRVEAAHALAQSAATASDAVEVSRLLRGRLDEELDGGVQGALTTSLGRLPYGTDADREQAVGALVRTLGPEAGPSRSPSTFAVIGAARGAASLARRCAQQQARCTMVVPVLERLLGTGTAGTSTVAPAIAARVRRLAASGLTALDALSADTRARVLGDADAEVRRLAVIALAAADGTTEAMALDWLHDEAMVVRHAVVQHAGRRWPGVAERALTDASPHVRLAAIDALGEARRCSPCAALVERAEASDTTWHVHAHALVALARSHAAAAGPHLSRAARSATWQTRMYAARAAAEAGDIDLLRDLARGMHPNVREAALVGLSARQHRDSDDLRLEALESGDYQLVLTAARTLEGTPRLADARRTLLSALTRLTRDGRDTSRDPRLAILDRLEEVGDAMVAEALRPWVEDYDEAVAQRAAAVIEARTGQPTAAAPASRERREPVPTDQEIDRLDGQHVTLALEAGSVVIRLAAREAPANAARFGRQVAAGAWDGLTFHRVEPGFVVQGGSPGANEYVGADLYTRDERGPLSHVRGTVGISTRGRDTGDGQIFINLVDNARLDHAYTIIGTVVSGMAIVDGMLEGATIVEARLAPR
jgi:cyclophilin family peptidyl-prolyl cis-trans isomerase/HEAT repeat protein